MDPRDATFLPDRIELTTIMPKTGDPHCCPTGTARWSTPRRFRGSSGRMVRRLETHQLGVGVRQVGQKTLARLADVRCDLGQPGGRFDGLDLAEEGAKTAEGMMAPVLQEACGLPGDAPVVSHPDPQTTGHFCREFSTGDVVFR
ncbi:MAG TPA: hypothetical protein VLR48_05345 [Thiocapsa sp.]|nr:hypothetical protein [Thiocapsa sp.]HSO82026.1 hypothetical protein [Thiocapsa sp.]